MLNNPTIYNMNALKMDWRIKGLDFNLPNHKIAKNAMVDRDPIRGKAGRIGGPAMPAQPTGSIKC
jgi:hypothetical protein